MRTVCVFTVSDGRILPLMTAGRLFTVTVFLFEIASALSQPWQWMGIFFLQPPVRKHLRRVWRALLAGILAAFAQNVNGANPHRTIYVSNVVVGNERPRQ